MPPHSSHTIPTNKQQFHVAGGNKRNTCKSPNRLFTSSASKKHNVYEHFFLFSLIQTRCILPSHDISLRTLTTHFFLHISSHSLSLSLSRSLQSSAIRSTEGQFFSMKHMFLIRVTQFPKCLFALLTYFNVVITYTRCAKRM